MNCKCHEYGYRDDFTYAELRAWVGKGLYCTSSIHKIRKWGGSPYAKGMVDGICPTALKALRTKEPNEYYEKKRRADLKRQGFTPKQVEEKLSGSKKRARKSEKVIAMQVDFDFDKLTEGL